MKLSRYLDIAAIFSCCMSLLFSILLLTSGYKHGVLNKATIAEYSYSLNETLVWPPSSTNSSVYGQRQSPVLAKQQVTDGIHWWVFTVHYLSICARYVAGSPTRLMSSWNVIRKAPGYIFRTDDPFIINFQRNGSQFPVLPTTLDVIHTAPPFATLILGLTFLIMSLGLLIFQACGWFETFSPLGFLFLASTFVLTSSALITSISIYGQDWNGYPDWVSSFLGPAWASVGFIYVVFAGKAVDAIMRKQRRKLPLPAGQ